MTPKEKAYDMLKTFYRVEDAIMCVNEILEQFPEKRIDRDINYEWNLLPHPQHHFWSQVKQILNSK